MHAGKFKGFGRVSGRKWRGLACKEEQSKWQRRATVWQKGGHKRGTVAWFPNPGGGPYPRPLPSSFFLETSFYLVAGIRRVAFSSPFSPLPSSIVHWELCGPLFLSSNPTRGVWWSGRGLLDLRVCSVDKVGRCSGPGYSGKRGNGQPTSYALLLNCAMF